MKRTVTLPVMRVMAALMLSLFAFAEALAQTEGSYYMNIYYKDGGKYRVAVQDVDKVDFTFDMSLVEGVEYVDLGLSVNWATFNIGADNPEDAGNYYQWGGLGTPELYDFDHCPYANGQNSESNDEQYTKYVLSARYGTVDRKFFLDPQDDAAHVYWGGSWRMPTYVEMDELLRFCNREWIEVNGTWGCKMTSTIPGYEDRSIFLPAVGYMLDDELMMSSRGYYWSAEIYNTISAYALYLTSGSLKMTTINRSSGQPIRPVLNSKTWKGITSFSLDKDTINIDTENTADIDVIVMSGDLNYSFMYYDDITWTSDNTDVVTVDRVGRLKILETPGRAVITASLNGLEAKCVVNVTEKTMEARLAQAYDYLKKYMPSADVIGDRHNDFGYASIMFLTDASGMDMVTEDNGYNWATTELVMRRNISLADYYVVWNYLYNQVMRCNSVIGRIAVSTTDSEMQFMLGQMYALRAFCYWNLAQLYQFNYQGNESKPCVPIITEANQADALANGVARSTVAQVYELIQSDINKAIRMLNAAQNAGQVRADKRIIDLSVAYGIRARINLTMGNWGAAADDAVSAINYSSARPATIQELSAPAFWSADEPNWMWGIIVNEDDPIVESGIVNFPSMMGSFNYGYSWYSGGNKINRSLFNSISSTDVRKGWWIDDAGYSPNLTNEQIAFIADYFGEELIQVKFAPYKNESGTDINANDIPLMRIEEMYLIIAECKARMGQADAVQVLENFVTTYRDPQYSFATPAADAQSLVDEIWRQRRIEFWGEGLSWFDIMRLGKGVDRRDGGFQDHVIYNVAPGDAVLLWPIPEREIDTNPLISAEDNNPFPGFPEPVSDVK
ncbi:MAG: RagB/SusD family nutrient uptake outer membrane protein [Bacteroidaceae bacterium]|nr:RagB/SusD family nutrient uptake outer membrane protein [Bacteroidaceae bacterium]